MANNPLSIPALRVRQWLTEWDQVIYNSLDHKSEPQHHFYIFSISAKKLRALSGIYRREIDGDNKRDGIQRSHEKTRSEEIARFVHSGYPWSTLSTPKRESPEYNDLRKPGWLPSSIIVNILRPGDKRKGLNLEIGDAIFIDNEDTPAPIVQLPSTYTGADWKPSELPPIEVIDGQHRLWAFDNDTVNDDFEVPVVAFHGLDISWQAYLFYTINIKPKKINASLAFDMYPMLRTEEWLDRSDSTLTYRETRAQELTEAMWGHPKSPWLHRINMLGQTNMRGVSQSSWIQSLISTYIKPYESRANSIGGLFGSPVGSDRMALPWNRAQQAAFLITTWQLLKDAVRQSEEVWAVQLREYSPIKGDTDPAFSGTHTLLNTDQGVRAILYLTNDMCYLEANDLHLSDWSDAINSSSATDEEAVSEALDSLRKQEVYRFLNIIASKLSSYDWRTASAPGLSEELRLRKLAFRGSSGYRELRKQITTLVSTLPYSHGVTALNVLKEAGFNT